MGYKLNDSNTLTILFLYPLTELPPVSSFCNITLLRVYLTMLYQPQRQFILKITKIISILRETSVWKRSWSIPKYFNDVGWKFMVKTKNPFDSDNCTSHLEWSTYFSVQQPSARGLVSEVRESFRTQLKLSRKNEQFLRLQCTSYV
jgi:hypothetical protein